MILRDETGRFVAGSNQKKVFGFKGFRPGLCCLETQYKIGEWETAQGKLQTCHNGLHFCKHPLDVFDYYPPSRSVYCSVEATVVQTDKYANKSVARNLRPLVELGVRDLMKAALSFTKDIHNAASGQVSLDKEHTHTVCNVEVIDPKFPQILTNRYCYVGYPDDWTPTTRAMTFGAYSVADGTSAIAFGHQSIAFSGHGRDFDCTHTAIAFGSNSYALSEACCSVSLVTGMGACAITEATDSVAVSLVHKTMAVVKGSRSVAVSESSAEATGKNDLIVLMPGSTLCASDYSDDCTVKAHFGTTVVFWNRKVNDWCILKAGYDGFKPNTVYRTSELFKIWREKIGKENKACRKTKKTSSSK